jgi:YD repeat-containing protein
MTIVRCGWPFALIAFLMLVVSSSLGPFSATAAEPSDEPHPFQSAVNRRAASHLGRGLPPDRFFIHHPGDPVNLRTGNLTLPGIDLIIPARGPSLELARTYNSRSTGAGLFGHRWQSNLEMRALRVAGTVAIVEADGSLTEFKPDGAAVRRYRAAVRGPEQVEERPDGSLVRWTSVGHGELFDRQGRLARIEDRNGNALRLEYRAGKVVKLIDASGRAVALTYGGPGGRFVTAVKDPAGGVIRYEYDARGRLISVTDQVGREGRYEYDGRGRLVRLTYADGVETHMTYEGDSGAVLAQHGPGSATTTYRYEWEGGAPLSRRTTVTDAGGRRTVYEYMRAGGEVVTTDPSGRKTTVLYDPDLHRPLSVSGPHGVLASYQYDGSGRLISETDALRQTTRYRYDPGSGRLIEVIDPAGQPVRFDYDSRGNRVAVVQAGGSVTRDVYNETGQIIERIDPIGARTRFGYDKAGNLIEQIDPSGQRTRYEYDALGRLVRRLEANGAETRWTYNGVGDLVKTLDAEGRATEYRYDSMRRLADRRDRSWGPDDPVRV